MRSLIYGRRVLGLVGALAVAAGLSGGCSANDPQALDDSNEASSAYDAFARLKLAMPPCNPKDLKYSLHGGPLSQPDLWAKFTAPPDCVRKFLEPVADKAAGVDRSRRSTRGRAVQMAGGMVDFGWKFEDEVKYDEYTGETPVADVVVVVDVRKQPNVVYVNATRSD